jgi:esterase/lipase
MTAKKWLFIIPVLLIIIYLCGPAPHKPEYAVKMPEVPSAANALENYIHAQESTHKLKPDNEARIVWYNDSIKNKTDYAIVYLHGFSASQFEGAPTHTTIAKMFGCNLYLSRLAEHGIDTTDALANLTADKYWESAKEALAIGRQLGNKIILMGTSTGGTNALQLAATYPKDVFALILLSPNIAINDPNAWILNNHWGKQIAHFILGSDYNTAKDNRPVYKQYWNYKYRLEGPVALEEMLETTMLPETFKKISQPVLLLYYFKDEQHQDPVVKVSAMKKMFDELSSPVKKQKAIANAGDHVIASPFKSKDVATVQKEIIQFVKEDLHIKPIIGTK